MRTLRRWSLFLCLFVAIALPLLSQGGPLEEGAGSSPELIVFLGSSPHAAVPEDVVARVNQRRPVPGVLGHGNPLKARFVLPFRASGEALQWLRANPDSPRAVLERAIVLTYPLVVDLRGVREVLQGDPDILNVGENERFEPSVAPSDPLFAATGNPLAYQWGVHMLNLPAAWDRIKGNAYLGVVDMGLQANHLDLQAFSPTGTYRGGNFRPHLSWDFAFNDGNVDELTNGVGPQPSFPNAAGHGTHVSGILAATSNNGRGVVGACWGCSLLMAKNNTSTTQVLAGITWLVDHGVQVINASFGTASQLLDPCNPPAGFKPLPVCTALDFAEQRGVIVVAASGNAKTDINFPARDPRVVAVGGITASGAFWEESCSVDNCGSNYTKTPGSKMQDLVAPAKDVLSTVYTGWNWLTSPPLCGDGSVADGYGLCTGTSMAAPFVAGVAGLIRSANPLLSRAQVRQILVENASRNGAWDAKMGYGVPDASAAVRRAMGISGGQVPANRLTPLFSLYSSTGTDHLYTVFPQVASSAIFGQLTETCVRPDPVFANCPAWLSYAPVGPTVPGYFQFPGIGSTSPRASVYVFTSQAPPYSGAPLLVPLYRLSYNPNRLNPANPSVNRDIAYTTEATGLSSFRSVGYELDGIEGYIYQGCTPEPQCIPAGAVRLYRLYHPGRDDYAIFPESELAQKQAQGYVSTAGLTDWIGYVYPNTDLDADQLIDGFEALLGTNPIRTDTDCDGRTDGAEVLQFPYGDPRGAPGCF